MERTKSKERAAPPLDRSRAGGWRWTVVALLVFVAADVALFHAFWGQDLTDGTVLPPISVYEEMARGELEPQPLERWHGLAMNDLRFVVWLVARNARTLLTRPTALFDAEQCYPARSSLALGEPGISQGVVASVGYLVTRDPIATYDLLLFGLPLISALAMFLLVRDWSGVPGAGVAAGLLYGFHGIKTWEVVHPYVWDTAWTVLALWLAVRIFSNPRWRDALGLAACVSLQIAGSFYALLSAIVIGVPFLAWGVWHHGLGRAVLARLGLAAGLALLVAWGVLGPYLELRSSGVLAPRADQHFLLVDWVLPGGFLFIGWLLAGLALLGLASRRGLDPRFSGDPRWVLGASAALLFALSAGGSVDPELGRPTPLFSVYGWLAGFVPGLDVIRSPASLYAGTHLALSILAGLGGAALLGSVPARFRSGLSIALILAAAGAVLHQRGPFGGEENDYRFVSLRPDPAALELFDALEALGNSGPILAIPVPPHSGVPRVTESLLLTAYHGRNTSECYNSYIPPELEDARRAAALLPSEAGARAARDLGFTTILLHHVPDQPFGGARRKKFERFVAENPDGPLIPLHGNDAMTAYAVTPDARSRWTETPLAPRLSVAAVLGEVEGREDVLVAQAGGRAVFYLPLTAGSRLRGHLDDGAGPLVVADESGEEIHVEVASGLVDFDLAPLQGEFVRISVGAEAGGAHWRDLRVVVPDAPPTPSEIPRAPYDVLMILFDSLRADEVEGTGGIAGLTPTLDALGAEGVRFDEARAPASWTRPSVASLLASVSPATHRISLLTEGLPERVPYLPEELSAAGYLTAALTHSSQLAPRLGFSRGFAHFERFYARGVRERYGALRTPAERAEMVWRTGLLPVLEAAGDRPWFVYLHEMDPHDPYEPPAPFDTRYAGGEDPTSLPTGPAHYMREGYDQADLDRLRGLYRGEIRFMDEFLSELLGRLREAQGDRATLLVFLSDHGEAFGEHGQLGHAQVVNEHQLRVPLVMRLDGVLPAGVRIDSPVDLTDVAPTLLDLLGLEQPGEMQGRSLLPLIERSAGPGRPRSFLAQSLAGFETALRHGRWKLVHDARASSDPIGDLLGLEDVDLDQAPQSYALYDLASDPGELRDLASEHSFVTSALRQLLAWERLRLAPLEPPRRPDPDDLGAEELEHLKALGYVE